MDILDKRKNGRNFVHAAFVYDVGLLVFGIPLGLYLCWRLSDFIGLQLGTRSPFLSGVGYVYLMLVGISLYRILFGYTRW